ncbi:MAG: hypothetical protein ACK5AO_00865 [bacterium]|jgi:hypothetical protein
MLYTQDELKFMDYWEANRQKERRLFYQLALGLPLGILFGTPIIVNFLLGRFWYKRADAVGLGQFNPIILIIAVLLIAVFIALLSRRFRWEKLEQQYIALKKRSEQDNAHSDL